MTVIDAACFPHIVDAILASASPSALLAFRATSTEFQAKIDEARLRHLVLTIDHDGFGVLRTHREGNGHQSGMILAPRLLCLHVRDVMASPGGWTSHIEEYTHVLDIREDVDPMVL